QFTQILAPGGGTNFGAAPYYTKMLVLPNGTILWNCGSPEMYVYTPDGTALASGKPAISNIVGNADGSYHLTGAGLNGISAGAAYGDDAQMDSNYPLVRLTSGATVHYARTYNWSNTGVMTSNKLGSTEFSLPIGLAPGTYSLTVVANGNSSASVPFSFPLSPPGITSLTLSGRNLTLTATNGLAGRTYVVLTSGSPALPLDQWTFISTNVLAISGNFTVTVTNAASFADAQQCFILRAQ
ncbi:MAG TPA: hypothetical protein VN281_20200, partial [Verrucomicrobiae bacterium]|nr:hypothetical protein [Verrucomicrobiae bacterium]